MTIWMVIGGIGALVVLFHLRPVWFSLWGAASLLVMLETRKPQDSTFLDALREEVHHVGNGSWSRRAAVILLVGATWLGLSLRQLLLALLTALDTSLDRFFASGVAEPQDPDI